MRRVALLLSLVVVLAGGCSPEKQEQVQEELGRSLEHATGTTHVNTLNRIRDELEATQQRREEELDAFEQRHGLR